MAVAWGVVMEAVRYKLITSPGEVSSVVDALRAEPAIGLDTETTGLDPHTTRLRLLQLATANETFVFDCFRLTPDDLRQIGRAHV